MIDRQKVRKNRFGGTVLGNFRTGSHIIAGFEGLRSIESISISAFQEGAEDAASNTSDVLEIFFFETYTIKAGS